MDGFMRLSKHARRRGHAAGFTLIELMIAVAIIGVLAGIGYPSYLKYVARGNRSAAQGFMLEVTSRQERYLLDARAYAQDLCTLYGITPACPGSSASPPVPDTVSPNYSVTITSVTAAPPGYVVQAAPIGGQANNDANCGTLTISGTGAKAASGPGGVANCWNR
jgi:type IV pilus assembly protein PilE